MKSIDLLPEDGTLMAIPGTAFVNGISFSPDSSLIALTGCYSGFRYGNETAWVRVLSLPGLEQRYSLTYRQNPRMPFGHPALLRSAYLKPSLKLFTASEDSSVIQNPWLGSVWLDTNGLSYTEPPTTAKCWGHKFEVLRFIGIMLKKHHWAEHELCHCVIVSTRQGFELRTVDDGTVLCEVKAGSEVYAQLVGLSADSSALFLRDTRRNTVTIWKIPSGAKVNEFSVQENSRLVLSPDGLTLAELSNKGTLYLWDLALGVRSRLLSSPAYGGYSETFSFVSPRLLALGENSGFSRTGRNRIFLVDTRTGTLEATFQFPYRTGKVVASPDAKWMAVNPEASNAFSRVNLVNLIRLE